jgi:hypothetical protein
VLKIKSNKNEPINGSLLSKIEKIEKLYYKYLKIDIMENVEN